MNTAEMLGAAATIAEVGPKLAKAVLGPLAALEVHLRYRGRRVRLDLKNGSTLEGTLLGQGLARKAHTLRMQDDQGDEHAVVYDDVKSFVVVREARLALRNPGAATVGFALFLEKPREDLLTFVERASLARSRIVRDEVLPEVTTFRFSDPPWEGTVLEVGEASELQEPPEFVESTPASSRDTVRGITRLESALQANLHDFSDRLRLLANDIAAALRREEARVNPLFYLDLETAEGDGISETAARLMRSVNPAADLASFEAYLEDANLIVFVSNGRGTFIERGSGEILLRYLRG